MNITKLKELAEKATPGPWVAGDDEDSDYFLVGPCGDDGIVYQSVVKLHSETNADYIAAANPAEILVLIANLEDARAQMERQKDEWLSWEAKRRDLEKAAAQLEDAQGEIRALRATEAGLRECLAELVEAADSMRGTYTFQQGKTPEDEDQYGHEAWAGEFLNERAEAARALLEKKE